MIIFLLFFLSIYGSLNFYFFFKAKSILHFSGKSEWMAVMILIVLILAPIIIRILESFHMETVARFAAYCGYLWMAFVFLFFFTHMTLDVLRYVLRFLCPDGSDVPMRNLFFCLALFMSLVLVAYGFLDAQQIRVKKLEIHTGKLTSNVERLRIVQLSDVHIGLMIRGKRLKNILENVKKENPDILISTGDLLDGELDNITLEAEQFTEIKPKYGKYAILGNHEYYAGIEKSLEFTKQAGFEILRDESKKVAGITIIGLDDPTGRKHGFTKEDSRLPNLFPKAQREEFVVLLKHQPTIRKDKNFNLQLSGHTHGGQIFPFSYVTRLFFPKVYGYHQLDNGQSVYISKGAGTWGPPVRVLASPEITVIDLIKQ